MARRNEEEAVRTVFCQCNEGDWAVLSAFHSVADDTGVGGHVLSFIGKSGADQRRFFWDMWDTAVSMNQVPRPENVSSVVPDERVVVL